MASQPSVELSSGRVPHIDRNMAILEVAPGDLNPAQSRHTVLILDCSASMWGSIESVKSDARRFVSQLDESNYVSIVVFSGHGRARLVCGPTLCKEEGKQMLSQHIHSDVYIMDLTVFSEPLELVLSFLKKSHIDSMATQAVLFTDGNAVPTQ